MDWSPSDPSNPYKNSDVNTEEGRKAIGSYIATTNSAPDWQSGVSRWQHEEIVAAYHKAKE